MGIHRALQQESLHYLAASLVILNHRREGKQPRTCQEDMDHRKTRQRHGQERPSHDQKLNEIKGNQGSLKGTIPLRGQTEPKRRFALIFADYHRFLENSIWETQIFAENRRNAQQTADWRLSPSVRPLKRGPRRTDEEDTLFMSSDLKAKERP